MELLTTKEMAKMVGIAPETACRWRLRGDGPRWVQQGRWVRYRVEDVRGWMMGHAA